MGSCGPFRRTPSSRKGGNRSRNRGRLIEKRRGYDGRLSSAKARSNPPTSAPASSATLSSEAPTHNRNCDLYSTCMFKNVSLRLFGKYTALRNAQAHGSKLLGVGLAVCHVQRGDTRASPDLL